MVLWFLHCVVSGGGADPMSAFNTEVAENPEIAEKTFLVVLIRGLIEPEIFRPLGQDTSVVTVLILLK